MQSIAGVTVRKFEFLKIINTDLIANSRNFELQTTFFLRSRGVRHKRNRQLSIWNTLLNIHLIINYQFELQSGIDLVSQ